MDSRALEYFTALTNRATAPNLLALIKDGGDFAEENQWLEFKAGDDWNATLARPTEAKLKDKVKAVWSEYVGQFANVSGGVVVWGIHAKKTEVRPGVWIDKAVENRLVQNPDAFRARLLELVLHAVDPALGGCLIEYFIAPGSTNEGFVVCYIPEGTHKPYRSELLGERQNNYYVRVNDSGIVAPRPFLQQLFRPETNPLLKVTLEEIKTNWIEFYRKMRVPLGTRAQCINISIKNEGYKSVRDGLIKVDVLPGEVSRVDFTKQDGDSLPALIPLNSNEFLPPIPRALHPGATLNVALLLSSSQTIPKVLVKLLSENSEPIAAVLSPDLHWTDPICVGFEPFDRNLLLKHNIREVI